MSPGATIELKSFNSSIHGLLEPTNKSPYRILSPGILEDIDFEMKILIQILDLTIEIVLPSLDSGFNSSTLTLQKCAAVPRRLVFKAYRRVYHSALGLRVIEKKKRGFIFGP